MTVRVALALSLLLVAPIGCGGGTSSRRTSPIETSERPPDRSTAAASPLAPLRPAGSEPILAALTSRPSDPSALVRAAERYASTDAAGMTLLWGVMYGALGADDADHPTMARAMVAALRDHVTMQREGTTTHVSTSLAPGSIPVLADGRSMRAPIAHLFELRVTTSLLGWDGSGWTLAAAVHVIVGLAHGSTPGTAGLESRAEVLAWLARAESAGVLDAFATWLVGPAFPDELAAYQVSHRAELDGAHAWIAASPFAPTHAVLPDDLVPFP